MISIFLCKLVAFLVILFLIGLIFFKLPQDSPNLSVSTEQFMNVIIIIAIFLYFFCAIFLTLARNNYL